MGRATPPHGYDPATGIGVLAIQFLGTSRSQRRALIRAMREAGLTVYGSGRGFMVQRVTVTGTKEQFDLYGQAAWLITGDTSAGSLSIEFDRGVMRAEARARVAEEGAGHQH